MTAIITNAYRIQAAAAFKNEFLNSLTDRNFYFFISRPDAWADENFPPTPEDTIADLVEVWHRMIAMKKIQETFISHGLPRLNWDTSGETIYFPYDSDDVDYFLHPTAQDKVDAAAGTYDQAGTLDAAILSYTAGGTYVITDNYNVYKCISNRNSNNRVVKSTVKPTGTSTSILETADGYRWKYITTLTASDQEKFVTNNWMPIQTLSADDGSFQWDVQQAAVDGAVEHIRVETEGSGYISHTGTAVSATSTTITLDAGASAVDDTYNNMTIAITAGTGAGQRRVFSDYVGATKQGTVPAWSTNPDATSTFEIYPTIVVSGDGSGLEAKPILSGGAIKSVSVVAPGSGYRFVSLSISGGAGTGGTLKAMISPMGGHGARPVHELGAKFLIVNAVFDFNESDFPQINDYRSVGILADVENFGGGTKSTASTLRATKSLTVSGITSGPYDPDEIITSNGSGTPTAKVIWHDTVNNIITFYQDESTGFLDFTASETLTGGTSGATSTIDSVADPEVEPFSGKLLVLENRRKATRVETQNEDFKAILEF